MSMLNRRTQILLDDERYRRLERTARASGRSVAAVIRDAIDVKLARDDEAVRRREAGEWLQAQPLSDAPEPDWADSKREMLDEWGDASAA